MKILIATILLMGTLWAETKPTDTKPVGPPVPTVEQQKTALKAELLYGQGVAAENSAQQALAKVAAEACPPTNNKTYKFTKVGDDWQCVEQAPVKKEK